MRTDRAKAVKLLRKRLLKWGSENLADYAWRRTDDPYAILVAEFMLHRTQKRQAEKVYKEFIGSYPTIKTFRNGDRNEIRQMLAPLGLNWRIDGMLAALDAYWEQYKEVPADHERLIRERSVGQYIAGATATFATNTPHTLIDTNIVRVVGRVFGLNLEGEARRRKDVIEAIEQSCDPQNPRLFYYAMIDLAHKLCLPRAPVCLQCPLLDVPCEFGVNYQQRSETS